MVHSAGGRAVAVTGDVREEEHYASYTPVLRFYSLIDTAPVLCAADVLPGECRWLVGTGVNGTREHWPVRSFPLWAQISSMNSGEPVN